MTRSLRHVADLGVDRYLAELLVGSEPVKALTITGRRSPFLGRHPGRGVGATPGGLLDRFERRERVVVELDVRLWPRSASLQLEQEVVERRPKHFRLGQTTECEVAVEQVVGPPPT